MSELMFNCRHPLEFNRPTQLLYLLIFSLFIGACQSYEDYITANTLEVSIDQSLVRVGENVTLTCRVTSADPDVSIADGLQWLKSTVKSNSKEETIARNDQLTSLYSKYGAGRYEIALVPIPGVTYYILHINLVRHEDTGRIRCVWSSNAYARDRDSVDLQVYKRPDTNSVSFDGYAEGSEFTVDEDEQVSLTCQVKGVVPLPHISIHLQNRSLGGHLLRNVSVNELPASSTKDSPIHYDFDVSVAAQNLIANHRDDGHRVLCTVGLPHANWTPVTASVYLNVRYRPRFSCNRTQSVELHARNVIVRCRLRSNPRPSSLSVRWKHEGDADETILAVGDEISDKYFLYEQVTDASSWKQTEIVFVIDEVKKENYGVYHFEATNDIGSDSHAVRLIQYYPPKTTTRHTTVITTTTHLPASHPSTGAKLTGNGAKSLSNNLRHLVLLLTISTIYLARLKSTDVFSVPHR